MRWIVKEMDENGKPEWSVYLDEAGYGNKDDWTHYDTYETRDEAIRESWNYTWEDYDKRDK
jgi:hypothetical protein